MSTTSSFYPPGSGALACSEINIGINFRGAGAHAIDLAAGAG
jgi:hypothetical protein